MDKQLKISDSDFGISLDFEADKENEVDKEKLEYISKYQAMKDLRKKGLYDDAFDIMIELNEKYPIDNNNS